MKITTRGRYALRVMVDLAEHPCENCISLRDIAIRQGISQKYLESIVSVLVRNGLLDSVHGKDGGYRLTRPAKDYSVGEILRLSEGSLVPVSCLDCSGEDPCGRVEDCKTRAVWDNLTALINDYLDSVSIADLIDSGAEKEGGGADGPGPR